MLHSIPYARADVAQAQAAKIVKWLGVDELLEVMGKVPPDKEFSLLLEFLVEFGGGLELARCRMEETLVEQTAISYTAYSMAVQKIKDRLSALYQQRWEAVKGGGVQ